MSIYDAYIGRDCMVRTHSAGVFAGILSEMEGTACVVTCARRVWYWDGAASLSELAQRGTSRPQNCKFPLPVESVLLTEVVEIIPITPEARATIDAVKAWSEEPA